MLVSFVKETVIWMCRKKGKCPRMTIFLRRCVFEPSFCCSYSLLFITYVNLSIELLLYRQAINPFHSIQTPMNPLEHSWCQLECPCFSTIIMFIISVYGSSSVAVLNNLKVTWKRYKLVFHWYTLRSSGIAMQKKPKTQMIHDDLHWFTHWL